MSVQCRNIYITSSSVTHFINYKYATMAQPLKLWSKFSVSKETDKLKFRIVEAPQDCIEDIAELIFNHFVTGEAMAKATGIPKSDEAMAEYKPILFELIKDEDLHIVICCTDDDNDEIGTIVGASLMTLTKKDKPLDLKFQPKSKELQKFFEIVMASMKMYDLMEEQKIDKYFDGRGVVVHSNYRRLGIAYELIKTRRRICQELGAPLTAALMTAYGTQKAAERDGWETVYEFNLEEFGKQFNVTFDKSSPPIAKFMVARA